MSFCRNCGERLNDNVVFCPKCGTQVNGSIQEKSAVSNQTVTLSQIRRMHKEEAERVYEYFMAKEDLYDDLLYYQREQARMSEKPPKKWFWVSLAGAEVIIALFAEGYILGGIIGTVATILLFILWRRHYKKKVEAFDNKLAENASKIEEICDELAEYYDGYEDCPIGPEYTFPSQLKELVDCITSGRAETFKEAINVLITDGRLRAMEENTERAATNAGVAATFAALDFFFN